MPTVFRAPPTVLQFFNNAGLPNVGGTLLTQVGGINSPTYQDAAGTIPLPNPIPLNSRGEVSDATGVSRELWLVQGVTYVFTLFDAAGNQIGQYPNISGTIDAATLASSIGSTFIGWIQAGVGAVLRFIQDKLRDTVHIKDYGAVCDGATDDTAAITACVTANPNRTINANGTALISSTITLANKQKLLFEGGITANGLPASYFIKKATMTTVGMVVGLGCVVEGGGISCQAGSTGGGIQLIGNSPTLRLVTVNGSGIGGVNGVAFRIGDNAGTNTNSWALDRCFATNMSSHAFWVHDGSGAPPNVNAGKLTMPQALNCGGDGVRIDNATNVTVDTPLCETVVGIGVNIGAGTGIISCFGHAVFFGDSEANTAGQINFGPFSNNNSVFSSPFAVVTDSGINTKRFDIYLSSLNDWQPLITAFNTTAKAGSAIALSGTTVTFTITGHTYIIGDSFSVTGTETLPSPKFNGGYIVANVIDVNTVTAIVSADRASKMPAAFAGAFSTLVGYQATTAGWYQYINGVITFGGKITCSNIAANALITTGAAIIAGFPLACRTSANESIGHVLSPLAGITYPASVLQINGEMSSAGFRSFFTGLKSAAASTTVPIGAGGVSQTASIEFGGSYRAI